MAKCDKKTAKISARNESLLHDFLLKSTLFMQ